MDTERMKAMIHRYINQLNSFQSILYTSFGPQPTWETWLDSCQAISGLAIDLHMTAAQLAQEYEKSIKEQEEKGIH